jgi:putative flippase GtrA
MPLQTFRYAACGGTNTVFDICLFSFGYHFVFHKQNLMLGSITIGAPTAALFFALCFSLPSGFYLNRYVVFQQTGLKAHHQLSRYLLITAICIVLNYLFLKLFIGYFGLYPTPAKILTTVFVIIFSYLSQTYILFRNRHTE